MVWPRFLLGGSINSEFSVAYGDYSPSISSLTWAISTAIVASRLNGSFYVYRDNVHIDDRYIRPHQTDKGTHVNSLLSSVMINHPITNRGRRNFSERATELAIEIRAISMI